MAEKARIHIAATVLALLLGRSWCSTQQHYEPTWDSLDQRVSPSWFSQRKFGIKMHWTVFAVPSFASKDSDACWYGNRITTDPETKAFHERVYGANFHYRDFGPMFKAEFFNATEWIQLFHRAGARYVRPVVKFMDGYTMWNSSTAPQWNSVQNGPGKDTTRELFEAGRNQQTEWAEPMKMGIHFELLNWGEDPSGGPGFGALGDVPDIDAYVQDTMLVQLRELLDVYQPDDL